MESRDVAPKKGLNFIKLLGVLFIAAIGGSYGMEGCVKSGGGLWTIIGVGVLPWVWGLPTAIVVAELATSMPANSGPDAWISCAFPTWFTIMSIVWTFTVNRVDNSLYPNLFISYLTQTVDIDKTWEVILMFVFVFVAALLNVIGVEIVGNASLVLMAITLTPFFVMFFVEFVVNYDDSEWGDMLAVPESGVDWGFFIPLIVWNISGFDSAGHIVEEVETSGTTLVKAFIALLFVTQTVYIMPIMAGISAQTRYFNTNNGSIYEDSGSADAFITIGSSSNFSQWTDGYFVPLAREVANGEEYLPYMMMIGGMFSSFGFMTSMLCTTSRALQGHAMLGLFPEPINRFLRYLHPTWKTPINAVMVNALFTFILAVISDFETLVSIDVVVYTYRLMAIFLSCLIIRMQHPTLKRPFKVPGGAGLLCVFVALPLLFCMLCIGVSAAQDFTIFGASLGIAAASFFIAVPIAKYRFPDGLDARITYDSDSDSETPKKHPMFNAENPISPTSGEFVSLVTRHSSDSHRESYDTPGTPPAVGSAASAGS